MPRVPVPPEVDDFLRRPNPAVVATLRPDGSPHSVPTWYDWEDGRALLNMDDTRLRLGYMRRDPRVALTVLADDGWYRHVSLLGQAVSIEDDEDLADIDRLAVRYTGQPFRTRDRKRVSAWMSTVLPMILNFTDCASASSESARCFFSFARAAFNFELVSLDAFCVVSAAAALSGMLVCVIAVSHVNGGIALLISCIT